MKARYIGMHDFPDLVKDRVYDVIAVSVPAPGVPFLRIIDSSGEDYLYPWDQFEIVDGEQELNAIISDPTPREVALA